MFLQLQITLLPTTTNTSCRLCCLLCCLLSCYRYIQKSISHATAVVVAMKNKMDLSLGVAVGSSIQIAIFAIPFVVIVGWITGHDFTLDFDPFATLALTVSVIHANFVTSDALSHWLMGVALITNYAIIALVFLYKT
jgi:Ca2+:H+ antiporter